MPRRPPAVSGWSEERTAWFLVLPCVLFLVALTIFPLIYSGWLSLQLYNLFRPDRILFYGGGNFGELFADSTFFKSAYLTLFWSVSVVAIELALGFFIAMLLDRRMRGIGVLRTVLIIPAFISPIAMGLTWRFMFQPEIGVINHLLQFFGLPKGLWIAVPESALPSVMIAEIWQWTPFVALVLLAGIQSLPVEVTEAARLDGLRGLVYVRKIVVPLILPVITVVVLIRFIDSIRIFDLIYVMTRGGPGSSTLTLSVYDYSIFQAGDLGKMAALGWIILIIVNIFAILFLRLLAQQEKRPKPA